MTEARLAPLRAVAAAARLDAVALVPGASFRRLMGRSFHAHERPLCLLVPPEGEPVAVVPKLEMPAFERLGFPGPAVPWADEDGYQGGFDRAAALLGRPGRIGVEGQVMRVFERDALARAFPGAAILDAGPAIAALRLRKDPDEIAALRAAIRVSEAALAATLAEVRVGMTETAVQAILLRHLFGHGAEGLAFHPIVAAGDNSAQPHASARPDYAIRPGDALLLDFGATCRGYNADITRTVFVGEPAPEDRALYEAVRAANAAGRAAARPGITAAELDETVLGSLEASPFAAFVRHKTGHGLGLEVHEAPQIMRGNRTRLDPGMVFTIEPGLYRAGRIGVRIEDDVAITPDGAESLTRFPRDLTVVG